MRRYAVAVDVGTTGIEAVLIELTEKKQIAEASITNPQIRYGHDVMSRITYELKAGEKGIAELKAVLIEGLNSLVGELCLKAHITAEDIREFAVSANTTMLHMLLGADARSLGRAPYTPVFTAPEPVYAARLGLKAAKGAEVYCLPAASAFIGGDAVGGACVCGLLREKRKVLLADIGTNGEFVLAKDGRLFACSSPAGPALEGMSISCGMRAIAGAIEKTAIREEGIQCSVIGDVKPRGLCGSGILSAVCEFLREGIIGRDGAFRKLEEFPETDWRRKYLMQEGRTRSFLLARGERPIVITQGDIRELQLARGALLSGCLALLLEAGISMSEVDEVVVAGQFGAHICEEDILGAGILPKEAAGKLRYAGNTSLAAACMALTEPARRQELLETAGRISHIELANREGYEELFVKCCDFT